MARDLYNIGGRLESYLPQGTGINSRLESKDKFLRNLSGRLAKSAAGFKDMMIEAAVKNPGQFDKQMAALSDLIYETSKAGDRKTADRYRRMQKELVMKVFPGALSKVSKEEFKAIDTVIRGSRSQAYTHSSGPASSIGSLLNRQTTVSEISRISRLTGDSRITAVQAFASEITGGLVPRVTPQSERALKEARAALTKLPIFSNNAIEGSFAQAFDYVQGAILDPLPGSSIGYRTIYGDPSLLSSPISAEERVTSLLQGRIRAFSRKKKIGSVVFDMGRRNAAEDATRLLGGEFSVKPAYRRTNTETLSRVERAMDEASQILNRAARGDFDKRSIERIKELFKDGKMSPDEVEEFARHAIGILTGEERAGTSLETFGPELADHNVLFSTLYGQRDPRMAHGFDFLEHVAKGGDERGVTTEASYLKDKGINDKLSAFLAAGGDDPAVLRAYSELRRLEASPVIRNDEMLRGTTDAVIRNIQGAFAASAGVKPGEAAAFLDGKASSAVITGLNDEAARFWAASANLMHGGVQIKGGDPSKHSWAIQDRSIVGMRGTILNVTGSSARSATAKVAIGGNIWGNIDDVVFNVPAFHAFAQAHSAYATASESEQLKNVFRFITSTEKDAARVESLRKSNELKRIHGSVIDFFENEIRATGGLGIASKETKAYLLLRGDSPHKASVERAVSVVDKMLFDTKTVDAIRGVGDGGQRGQAIAIINALLEDGMKPSQIITMVRDYTDFYKSRPDLIDVEGMVKSLIDVDSEIIKDAARVTPEVSDIGPLQRMARAVDRDSVLRIGAITEHGDVSDMVRLRTLGAISVLKSAGVENAESVAKNLLSFAIVDGKMDERIFASIADAITDASFAGPSSTDQVLMSVARSDGIPRVLADAIQPGAMSPAQAQRNIYGALSRIEASGKSAISPEQIQQLRDKKLKFGDLRKIESGDDFITKVYGASIGAGTTDIEKMAKALDEFTAIEIVDGVSVEPDVVIDPQEALSRTFDEELDQNISTEPSQEMQSGFDADRDVIEAEHNKAVHDADDTLEGIADSVEHEVARTDVVSEVANADLDELESIGDRRRARQLDEAYFRHSLSAEVAEATLENDVDLLSRIFPVGMTDNEIAEIAMGLEPAKARKMRAYVLGQAHRMLQESSGAQHEANISNIVTRFLGSNRLNNARIADVEGEDGKRYLRMIGVNRDTGLVESQLFSQEQGYMHSISGDAVRTIHAGIDIRNFAYADDTAMTSIEAINMKLINRGISTESALEEAKLLMPGLNADMTARDFVETVAHVNREKAEMPGARISTSAIHDPNFPELAGRSMNAANFGDMDILDAVALSREYAASGMELPSGLRESMVESANLINSVHEDLRTGVISDDLIASTNNFKKAMKLDPLETVKELRGFTKTGLGKVAVGTIAVLGMAAAARALSSGETHTDQFLQYDHPGAEGITRVSSNTDGYEASSPRGRSTPYPVGQVSQRSALSGHETIITVRDNTDSMSANDIDNLKRGMRS